MQCPPGISRSEMVAENDAGNLFHANDMTL